LPSVQTVEVRLSMRVVCWVIGWTIYAQARLARTTAGYFP